MKITIKQIAEIAGVHRSTVDKVLHNREGVSQEVRQRVQKIIDEYGYRPNPIGQALKKQDQKIKIGVILLEVDAKERILSGIKEGLSAYQSFDIELMYHTVNYPDVGEQIRLIHKMIEQKADGIILSPDQLTRDREFLFYRTGGRTCRKSRRTTDGRVLKW